MCRVVTARDVERGNETLFFLVKFLVSLQRIEVIRASSGGTARR